MELRSIVLLSIGFCDINRLKMTPPRGMLKNNDKILVCTFVHTSPQHAIVLWTHIHIIGTVVNNFLLG